MSVLADMQKEIEAAANKVIAKYRPAIKRKKCSRGLVLSYVSDAMHNVMKKT